MEEYKNKTEYLVTVPEDEDKLKIHNGEIEKVNKFKDLG